jgi:hypothetical protein
MVFGGLAGALIIADWKEQGYFLYLYSLGLSSKRLIGWFMVPLFFVFVLLLMEIHIVRPYLSERISSYAINNVPVGQPFSIDNTVFFFPEQRLGQFFHVELVHNAVHIKALSGRIEQGSFELQSGSGIADSVSFDFGAMVVPFPVVKTAKSLHQRTAIELLDNGGRRERMELIKRFTIPFCFLLFGD